MLEEKKEIDTAASKATGLKRIFAANTNGSYTGRKRRTNIVLGRYEYYGGTVKVGNEDHLQARSPLLEPACALPQYQLRTEPVL